MKKYGSEGCVATKDERLGGLREEGARDRDRRKSQMKFDREVARLPNQNLRDSPGD